MLGDKSIIIIKKLNEEKLKSFENYLASTYFNNRKNILKLYLVLRLYAPNYNIKINTFYEENSTKLDKQFSEEKYLIKIFSFLYKELENFIIVEEHKKDIIASKIKLLKYYNAQNINNLYKESLKDIVVDINNSTSEDAFLHKFYLNELECNFQSKNDLRKGDINYFNTLNALDEFYYYQKYRLLCAAENRNKFIPNKISNNSKNNLEIPSAEILNNIVIKIYYHLYLLLTNDQTTEDDFYNVYNLLDNSISKIPIEDISIIYGLLTNCTKVIFKEKDKYYFILLDIYKKQINLGSIYDNNKIHISNLNNVVKLSILNDDIEWGIDFLEANKNKITPDENQLESFYYLIGELYFAQKKYDLALENLAKSKSTDNLVKLSIKRLYLKIFFEKREINTFDSFAISYKTYISREKSLLDNRKEVERKFVNYFILINKYLINKNKNKLKSLKQKIEQENFSDKIYLLNSINRIIAKKD